MITILQLIAWRDAQAAANTGAKFLWLPEAWLEDTHWMCANGHVSERYLKHEAAGPVCLACREPVIIGPPMSEEELSKLIREGMK